MKLERSRGVGRAGTSILRPRSRHRGPWQTVGLAQRLTGRGLARRGVPVHRAERRADRRHALRAAARPQPGAPRRRGTDRRTRRTSDLRRQRRACSGSTTTGTARRPRDRSRARRLAPAARTRSRAVATRTDIYGGRVPWRPEHDGSAEHEAWARDYFDKTGEQVRGSA